MTKTSIRAWSVSFAGILGFYLLTFPSVPMGLDSAEMALQGLLLGVMHPPGYPLLTLYNYVWVHGLPFLSPVVAVGLGNLALGLVVLALLGKLLVRFSTAQSQLLVLGLAVTPLFWKYATTPEVFIGLQLFALGFVFLLFDVRLYRSVRMLGFLAASVAHHHAIVFLAPILAYAAWMNRRAWRWHLVAVGAGIGWLAFYGVLLAANPTALFSWGYLLDWESVLEHFLRLEYGTFSLAPGRGGASFFERLGFAASVIVENSWFPLSLIGVIALRTPRRLFTGFPLKLLGTFLFYTIGFVLLGEMTSSPSMQEVYARFLVLPVVLVYCLAGAVWTASGRRRQRLAWALGVVAILSSAARNYDEATSGLREMNAAHVRDVLVGMPRDAVLAVPSDSFFFTSAYYQAAEGLRRDVALTPLHVVPWRHVKLRKFYPELFNEDYRTKHFGMKLRPGRGFHYVGMVPPSEAGMEVEALELTSYIRPGATGLRFKCDPNGPRYRGPAFPLRHTGSSALASLSYGRCDFIRGLYLLRDERTSEAYEAFSQSLRKNPWSPYTQERLCHAQKLLGISTTACDQRLEELIENTAPDHFNKNQVNIQRSVKVNWD